MLRSVLENLILGSKIPKHLEKRNLKINVVWGTVPCFCTEYKIGTHLAVSGPHTSQMCQFVGMTLVKAKEEPSLHPPTHLFISYPCSFHFPHHSYFFSISIKFLLFITQIFWEGGKDGAFGASLAGISFSGFTCLCCFWLWLDECSCNLLWRGWCFWNYGWVTYVMSSTHTNNAHSIITKKQKNLHIRVINFSPPLSFKS